MRFSLILWAVWYAYWIVSARNRVRDTGNASIHRESPAHRLAYMVLIAGGFVLLLWTPPVPMLNLRLWPSAGAWLVLGLVVQTMGLAFAVWARATLGKNWSGRITTGGSQELVLRGPYRMVRHPIYSGLLLGTLGTTIVLGLVRGFVGLSLVIAGILIKTRREGGALRQHFGEVYREYERRVPGLIPGWPV